MMDMTFDKTDIYPVRLPPDDEVVYADPLVLRRAILSVTKGRCWEWAKTAKEYQAVLAGMPNEDTEEIRARRADLCVRLSELEGVLAGAAFEAFELERIDPETGHGVTETAALEILQSFLEWLEGKGG